MVHCLLVSCFVFQSIPSPYSMCCYHFILKLECVFSQQLEQASGDVEKVLESYEKSGKVPSTVMEARLSIL